MPKEIKEIRKSQYLMVVGLFALAENHYKSLLEIEKSIAEILGEKEEFGSYGHISDSIWGGERNVDDILKKMDIQLKRELKCQKK